jgi:hypothetical protein
MADLLFIGFYIAATGGYFLRSLELEPERTAGTYIVGGVLAPLWPIGAGIVLADFIYGVGHGR